MSETRSYPRHIKTDFGDIEVRLMSQSDEAAVLDFAQKLPTHDLLFLPRNISQPKVLSAWIAEIERGQITSLLAIRGGEVVGCSAVVRDPHSWSPHVGEIRMVLSPGARGQGVGRALSQETFALALEAGLEKLTVQMTVDQRGAMTLFESLGFRAEGLLRDQVRDVDGKKQIMRTEAWLGGSPVTFVSKNPAWLPADDTAAALAEAPPTIDTLMKTAAVDKVTGKGVAIPVAADASEPLAFSDVLLRPSH
jgi:RimJ/RimL family protein N-acetyltransferase